MRHDNTLRYRQQGRNWPRFALDSVRLIRYSISVRNVTTICRLGTKEVMPMNGSKRLGVAAGEAR